VSENPGQFPIQGLSCAEQLDPQLRPDIQTGIDTGHSVNRGSRSGHAGHEYNS